MTSIDLQALAAEFPKDAISWRANSVSKKDDGTGVALALAYIDARDVMERLDAVCGVAGWQDRYPHANGKTCCEIGVKCGDEWVWKANGAGDSDVEAEKGAFSDAFKRAAVMWGIGRYLYDDRFKGVWVPCTLNANGKFKDWTVSPWTKVKQPKSIIDPEEIKRLLNSVKNIKDLTDVWGRFQPELATLSSTSKKDFDHLVFVKDSRKIVLTQGEQNVVSQ